MSFEAFFALFSALFELPTGQSQKRTDTVGELLLVEKDNRNPKIRNP
jgi:hypothetical protein